MLPNVLHAVSLQLQVAFVLDSTLPVERLALQMFCPLHQHT